MCIPDKRYTFDAPRSVTPFEHIEKDFREGPAWHRTEHFKDWVEHVEHIADPAGIAKRADELVAQDYSIHYHVWTMNDLVDLLRRAPRVLNVRYDIECLQMGDGEVVVVLRKPAEP